MTSLGGASAASVLSGLDLGGPIVDLVLVPETADTGAHLVTALRDSLAPPGAVAAHTVGPVPVSTALAELSAAHVAFSPQLLHLHAATLVSPSTGSAVLVSGPSRSGKSTAAALLTRAGFGYVNDECTDVDDTGLVRGWAKPLSLRAGARSVLGLDSSIHLVAPSALGSVSVGCHSVSTVVVLDPSEGLEPVEIDGADAVNDLIQEHLDFGRRPGDLARVVALLRTARAVRIGRLTPGSLIDVVQTWVHLPPVERRVTSFAAPDVRSPGTLVPGPSVEAVGIDGVLVVFDRSSRLTLVVDPPGLELWSSLDGIRNASAVVSDRPDQAELLADLRSMNLLVESP